MSLILQSSATTCEIDLPMRPYKTSIRLALDIAKMDDNTYQSYDNGTVLDQSSCDASFELPYSQAIALDTFLRAYRGESFTMSMNDHSGFYPFGAHRGNVGNFLVSCEVIKQEAMVPEPFRYFKTALRFVNVGSFPAFALPDEKFEGDVSIAGVNDLRFPDNYFDVNQFFSRSVVYDEKSYPYYDNRSSTADQGETRFKLTMNTSKAAALLTALAVTYRSNPFDVVIKNQQYMFGEHYGADRTFSAKLIQTQLDITHDELHVFNMELNLFRVSG